MSNSVDFILFDIWINGFWLYPENISDIAKKLEVKEVPFLGQTPLADMIHLVSNGELESSFSDIKPEGAVGKPVVQLVNRMGERVITKLRVRELTSDRQ